MKRIKRIEKVNDKELQRIKESISKEMEALRKDSPILKSRILDMIDGRKGYKRKKEDLGEVSI